MLRRMMLLYFEVLLLIHFVHLCHQPFYVTLLLLILLSVPRYLSILYIYSLLDCWIMVSNAGQNQVKLQALQQMFKQRIIRFDHQKDNKQKNQQQNIKVKEMDGEQICFVCDMHYSSNSKFCPFCESPSSQPNKRNISAISCPKCNFQNALENTICVACDTSLFEKEQIKVSCQHCGLLILKRLIEEHSTNCLLSMQLIKQHQKQEQARKQLQKYQATQIKCKYCGLVFPEDLIRQHNEVCLSKPKPVIKPPIIKPPIVKPAPYKPPHKVPLHPVNPPEEAAPYEDIQIPSDIKQQDLFQVSQVARLSPLQKNAILYMQSRSLKEHGKVRNQLQQRTRKLGFKKQDLENLLFYIQNYAPIIIHIHITKHMEFFIKDTHYRNQFQTGKSSGSLSRQSRTQWQNRMFDKRYAKATDHQRVKYGVINFTNDPKGVNCALGYGMSYFLLKQHVRNRCTMTDMDSSSASSVIGTFKYCFHILNKMNDKQLTSAFNAAKALEQSSTVTTTYKQIQIHGPIEFAKDIQRVYVNKKEVQDKKFLDMVYSFCERNKIDYQFI